MSIISKLVIGRIDFCVVKIFISIIFLLSFSLQTFYTAGMVFWFFANQKSISQKHCINKNRPLLKCNGKCFLAKKIKAAEEQQEKESTFQLKWVESSPGFTAEIVCPQNITQLNIVHTTFYKVMYHYQYQYSIFHPPSFC